MIYRMDRTQPTECLYKLDLCPHFSIFKPIVILRFERLSLQWLKIASNITEFLGDDKYILHVNERSEYLPIMRVLRIYIDFFYRCTGCSEGERSSE